MTNEPGEKNNSFADPAPKLRVKKGSDGDLIDGGATGQGAEESCRHDHADSVVAPYVPPEVGSADGESVVAPFVPLATKVKADHAKIHPQSGRTTVIDGAAKRILQDSKIIFVALALVIGMTTAFCLTKQRLADQYLLDHHSDLAQLAEYAKKEHEAAFEWTQAISVAKRMQSSPKVIADLDMRAAQAWSNDSLGDTQGLNPQTVIDNQYNLIESELREAVSLYSRSDDCQAAEIKASSALAAALRRSYYERPIMPTSGRLMQFLRSHPPAVSVEKALFPATTDRSRANELIPKLAARSRSREEAQSLIPLMHSFVNFKSIDLDEFVQSQQLLDTVIRQAGYDPLSYADRLRLAQDALAKNDYESALVEYSRCLGIKQDETTRQQFLLTLQRLNQQSTNYSAVVRDHEEALAVLMKLRMLQTKCFGPESGEAARSGLDMASVLSSLGRFDDAEQIIDNLPVTHRNSPTARATRGSVLARAGKFDQALLILNQAMTPPNAERSGILDSLVRIYASTGHYKEAQHSLRQLASPPDKLPLEDPSIFGIGPASTYGSPTLE